MGFLRFAPLVGCHRGADGTIADHRQLALDQPFDVAQITAFGPVAERKRDPFGAGPRRPPDTVDITFRLVGKLIVDDMGDTIDVDAPGGDIGRHQNPRIPGTEPF